MRFPVVLPLAILALAGCSRHQSSGFQGYLEGEYVYIASPLAGTSLFTLERSAELATQRQAGDQLRAAAARLEDLKKGSRPTEVAALTARVEQAKAAAELSRLEFARQEQLYKTQVISANEFDRVRLAYAQNQQAVEELNAQLTTAQLGARSDVIAAATADMSAAQAAKERADWSVDQKAQPAPKAGLVYDTLYRQGEYVTAGNPIVVLLPPENIKVRFFVPEANFGTLKAGDPIQVSITGRSTLAAHVTYLSPQPEYTPPVLYNRENRSKLVFLVEAVFDGGEVRDLHPGQPVDVSLAR